MQNIIKEFDSILADVKWGDITRNQLTDRLQAAMADLIAEHNDLTDQIEELENQVRKLESQLEKCEQ